MRSADRDGKEKLDQSIQENADFARWAASQDSDMIAAMFGGHALFTLPDDALDRMVEANNGLTGFHIHVCEGMDDVYDSGPEAWLHVDSPPPTTESWARRPCSVTASTSPPPTWTSLPRPTPRSVNNPQSNANNAVGTAPVLEFFKRGITVTMGTDAYTHDMLQSLKAFVPLQRLNSALPNVAWGVAMTMLFKNNADGRPTCTSPPSRRASPWACLRPVPPRTSPCLTIRRPRPLARRTSMATSSLASRVTTAVPPS